ncbi:hypothetical protein AMATHDRAFT_8799 [Amanita thiersii Skay4041]|uniref:Retrotransposon gag domain-containing protein n=1 Tax=Amanita thiersii Skay4041 TaxID=703135 RepID=A0A2A9NBQ8_9AGAR|nr:hypothetical protein AMATHDRAFT_8799 [Amanita thiersii Skay4041]
MDPILFTLLPFYYLLRIFLFPLRMMVGATGGGTEELAWTLDHAIAQIQQLMGNIAALQNMVQQQNVVIQQLQNQQPVANNRSPARGPKMAAPPFYDGSMATYVTAKIMWILSYMQTGMAQRFRDSFLTYMNTNEYQTEFIQVAPGVDATEILYRNIYQAFGNPNKQATAILELMTMKQGTKSAEEHVQLFKQAYSQSGYQETAGIHELKRSLNTPLLDKCMMVPELPNTLDKWYELVIRLDRQWRQVIAEKKIFATRSRKMEAGSNNTSWPNQSNPSPPAHSTRSPTPPARNTSWQNRDPNAMDVDHN